MRVHLLKRGRIFYACYRWNGMQVKKSLKTDNRNYATILIEDLEKKLILGQLIQKPRLAIQDVVVLFARYFKNRRTKDSARTDLNRLDRFLQAYPVRYLDQITPALVREYLDSLVEAGRAPKTANEYRFILHNMFEFACRELDYVSPNPAYPNPIKQVRPYPVPAPEIIYLNCREIEEQLSVTSQHPGMQAAIATMIFAGIRRAELTWLTIEDLQLNATDERGWIRIRPKTDGVDSWQPKTKKQRTIPVSARLSKFLTRHLENRPRNSRWLFHSPHGCRWNEDNFSTKLRDVQHSAGLTWTCNHFRHTFANSGLAY